MRYSCARLGILLSLLIGSSGSAVTMAWTPIGNPGNACDPQGPAPYGGCFGAVGTSYSIGTYEVTNAQYAEFLNAVAATDTYGLYNTAMGQDPSPYPGGITRSGNAGTYTYTAMPGREGLPVNYVAYYDALRFANWMSNGQPIGVQSAATTEGGAYTFSGATAVGGRNPGAIIVLTSEDEWYKSAYHDPSTGGYFDYPASSDAQTTCSDPGATPNTGSCDYYALADVGSYTGAASPSGTYDQGGNVRELTEGVLSSGPPTWRIARGGSFVDESNLLAAEQRVLEDPTHEDGWTGFRLVMIPEPSTGLLVIAGLLGLGGWCRGVPSTYESKELRHAEKASEINADEY